MYWYRFQSVAEGYPERRKGWIRRYQRELEAVAELLEWSKGGGKKIERKEEIGETVQKENRLGEIWDPETKEIGLPVSAMRCTLCYQINLYKTSA